MLTFAGIICALQHLQLCNSHQGAVWLWIYMYILKSVSQVRTPNAKCIAQEHWEDLSLPLKSSGAESRKNHRCNWNIFLFWFSCSDFPILLFAMLLKLGERKLLLLSDPQQQFHKDESVSEGKRSEKLLKEILEFSPKTNEFCRNKWCYCIIEIDNGIAL